MNTPGEFDVGPLTWVKGEIELALGRSGEALQNFAGTAAANGGTPPDLAQIRPAQVHLHQASGVLSIVGLPGVVQFADAIEQIFGAVEKGSLAFSSQAAKTCQRGLDAIRQYLDELTAGAPDQPLRLLPVYRELMALRGIAEASPADLFFPDLSLRPPRREKESAPLSAESLSARLKAARLGFQRGLLKWLKGEAKGLTEMRNSVAVIEFTQPTPAARTFWWISLAFLDALIVKGVSIDSGVKRMCARIDAQIAKLLEGAPSVAERLVRDALYYVATSSATTDHVECVRAAYQLADQIPASSDSTAMMPPQLRAMRDTLAAAKDTWGRYAAGTAVALPQFHEQAKQLDAQVREIGQTDLARLVAAIGAVSAMLRNTPAGESPANAESMALEIATALLLAENAVERFGQLGVDFAHQVDVMAGRLTALLRGETPSSLQAMEVPHLDEISQRAQERLLMHQVSREILSNLAGIEQALDGFFRDTARIDELATLSKPLKQVAGALTILGEIRAVEVLRECERQIAGFAAPGQSPSSKDFEDLAHKLSAIGFFVEQLQHGPADLDAILSPAASEDSGEESGAAAEAFIRPPSDAPAMARMTRTAIDALKQQAEAENKGGRDEVRQQVETIREEAGLMADADVEQHAAAAIAAIEIAAPGLAVEHLEQAAGKLAPLPVAPSPEASRLATAGSAVVDAELLSIFLEEAHEVLGTIGDQLQCSRVAPHDHDILTTIRRGFHTLKGSGRMVGLTDLGETAWAVEQAMNHWLQQGTDATPELHAMVEKAHALFSAWVTRLDGGDTTPQAGSAELVTLCERIRGIEEKIETPSRIVVPATEALAEPSAAAPVTPPAPEEVLQPQPVADERIAIGPLLLAPAIYDIFLKEARSHLTVLEHERQLLAQSPPTRTTIRAAHTLAGISGTLGVEPISALARAVERSLDRFVAASAAPAPAQCALIEQAIAALDTMLTAFAQREMPQASGQLQADVDALSPVAAMPPASIEGAADIPAVSVEPATALAAAAAPAPSAAAPAYHEEDRRKTRIEDDLDLQLLPIFLEEGMDILREIGNELRNWHAAPTEREIPQQLQRLLHTLKGGARMAGAMRLGELAHSIETRLDQALRSGTPGTGFIDEVESSFDRVMSMLESLSHAGESPAEEALAPNAEAEAGKSPATRQTTLDTTSAIAIDAGEVGSQRALLRVRAELVDQLVNDAGEIAIARARVEGEMRTIKSSLLDLSENAIRLRQQLREIEIQAEGQMQSQMAQRQESHQQFDPLEMDRFTRFQELTRMMAESVNDVTTVQHNLLRNLDHAAGAMNAQARLNRELSQALMSVRMVPFNSIVDRLYRIVRQTAKELDKRVNLDLRDAQIELDRSVLEKMIGPLEHLLRNAIVHGIESREVRQAANKQEIGEIILTLAQQNNEIVIELGDDGGGLNFERIRQKAVEQGLLDDSQEADERRLTQFIFMPGFSTAGQLTEVAGRGVGMDVVKAEVSTLGGRIEVSSRAGAGTCFRIYLPLTLAVTQALLIRSGNRTYALPSTMIEQVMELKADAAGKIRAEGSADWLGNRYYWHYLESMLNDDASIQPPQVKRYWMLLLKGGERPIALEVDGLVGNQEIVVKNIGPQLARVPGISGATVLNDGEIALILNPIALAGRELRAAPTPPVVAPTAVEAPLIMVVDDSLTVRKIVGRLLAREGYRVVTAKDGVDAVEQLADCMPAAMLVDIEMPRMDGFDLARNVRANERLKHIPIIMITSRIAEKHRNYAEEIGVNEYLGKPYDEEELLHSIAGFVTQQGLQVPAKP